MVDGGVSRGGGDGDGDASRDGTMRRARPSSLSLTDGLSAADLGMASLVWTRGRSASNSRGTERRSAPRCERQRAVRQQDATRRIQTRRGHQTTSGGGPPPRTAVGVVLVWGGFEARAAI